MSECCNKSGCGCGHEHNEHEHEQGACGCANGHDHEHEQGACGCANGHDHEHGHNHDDDGCGCGHDHGGRRGVVARIIISAVLAAGVALAPLEEGLKLALSLVPYLIIGWDILLGAWRGILKGRPFDENFLMAVATIGALVLGEYVEALAVMLFYQIGESFQAYAVSRSRRSIRALMDIRPDHANLKTPDGWAVVNPADVEVGSVILVNPGEKIPLDGVIIRGATTLDTTALTGESMPRDAAEGQEVLSGCINLTGPVEIRTQKEFAQSTVSRILELCENAREKKSRSESFISRFARVYTPAVCLGALALAVLPPVLLDGDWRVWIYRALTFLVISCPCALVVSIPLSFFAGIGGASRAGVLVKGSNYLEALAGIRCVAFDKTGTLTRGVFEVSAVHGQDGILEYAALAESHSSHPISQSLRRAWGGEAEESRVSDVTEIAGHGVTATVDGRAVAVGNAKLMARQGAEMPECECRGTVVHVAIDGAYAGHIAISDSLKSGALSGINALKSVGISDIIMLTGDSEQAAAPIANVLGIDCRAELLPGDKVELVEQLIGSASGKVAFVGDGINDAPVLSRADVGIAMGAMGSDAAIESADVVLMDDNPEKLAQAVKISRRCLGIVYQNIVFAIGVKALCLVLGAAGIANMWFAIFADVGVMLLAVLNAIRALKAPRR